ncbi:MAG TPA: FAD-dependent oxidoreductase, partial [Candidatus Acidoferrales bacterium]|nr:FAD-dependent oxidoreductase [Candidatus Acidoferrales bacterium]
MPKKALKSEASKTVVTSQLEEYDLLILGSGTAGKLLSWTLSANRMKTANVERKYVGGACVNIACLPSKNVIQSAKVASYFFRSAEFGITKDNVQIHMDTVRERKRKMVAESLEVHLANYKASGAELIFGSGRFIGPKTIEVTLTDGKKRVLRGKKVVINTGTRATIEPIPGLAEVKPLTHVEALELGEVPEHLLVIGGGYVGLELSQAMRRFGSNVSLIERSEQLVSREDDDVSEALAGLFRDEGVEVFLNAETKSVSGKSGESVRVVIEQNGVEKTLEGSHVLVATGRKPN